MRLQGTGLVAEMMGVREAQKILRKFLREQSLRRLRREQENTKLHVSEIVWGM
jgi:hypothetical protein